MLQPWARLSEVLFFKKSLIHVSWCKEQRHSFVLLLLVWSMLRTICNDFTLRPCCPLVIMIRRIIFCCGIDTSVITSAPFTMCVVRLRSSIPPHEMAWCDLCVRGLLRTWLSMRRVLRRMSYVSCLALVIVEECFCLSISAKDATTRNFTWLSRR